MIEEVEIAYQQIHLHYLKILMIVLLLLLLKAISHLVLLINRDTTLPMANHLEKMRLNLLKRTMAGLRINSFLYRMA